MRSNYLFQLSEMTELQIINMQGEKVSGFFNICVYTLSSLSFVSTAPEGKKMLPHVYPELCLELACVYAYGKQG